MKRRAVDEDEMEPLDIEAAANAQSRLEALLAGAFEYDEDEQDEAMSTTADEPIQVDHQHAFRLFHGDDNIVRISEGMGAESIAIQRKIEWDSDEEDEIRKRLESVVVTFKDVVKEGKRMKVNERWTRRVEVIPLKRVVEEKGTLRDYLMKLKAQRRESAKPTPVIAEGASALMVRKRRQRLSQEKRRKKIAMKTGKTEIKKEVKKDAKKEVKKDQGLKKMKKIKIVKSGVKGLKELAVIYGRDLGCRGVVKGMDRVVAARLNANFTSQGYRPPFRPRMY